MLKKWLNYQVFGRWIVALCIFITDFILLILLIGYACLWMVLCFRWFSFSLINLVSPADWDGIFVRAPSEVIELLLTIGSHRYHSWFFLLLGVACCFICRLPEYLYVESSGDFQRTATSSQRIMSICRLLYYTLRRPWCWNCLDTRKAMLLMLRIRNIFLYPAPLLLQYDWIFCLFTCHLSLFAKNYRRLSCVNENRFC